MRTISYYLFVIFLATSCQKQPVDLEVLNQELRELHLATYTNINDSTVSNLYEVKRVLRLHPDLPDSRHAYNNNLLGLYHRNKGNLDSAAYYYYRSTEYVPDTLPLDSQREVSYFNNTWEVFGLQNKFGDCISVADRFAEVIHPKDSVKQGFLNYLYATTYYNTEQYDKAAQFNENQQKFESLSGLDKSNSNAKIMAARLARNHFKDNQRANEILEQLIRDEANYSMDQNRQIFGTYAIYLFYDEDFKRALDYYKKGLSFTKQLTGSRTKTERLATTYLNLSEVNLELKDFSTSQKYLDSALAQGVENIDRELNRDVLKYKIRLAVEAKGNMQQAMLIADTLATYLDRDYQEKYNQELVALTKANEKEKELLAQQQLDQINNLKLQTRLFLALGFIVLLTGLGLLFYRQRKLRFERAGLQMQQRLLRSQMNPHFTFNTLYAIQRQIKEAPEKAHDYLLKFSRLLRLILENSMQNYVLLENELESLRKYMDLQLLRFPEKFTYTIELISLEEDDPVYIPPMLIQPFVENAIEHGFSSIDYLGELKIVLSMENKYVSCTVIDNGLGKNSASSINKKSTSTQLISDFLSKATGSPLSINHVNHQQGKSGTIVKFLIPYNNNTHD